MGGNTKSYTAGDSVAAQTRLRLGKACHGGIVKSERYFSARIHRTAGHAFVLWFRDHVAAINQRKVLTKGGDLRKAQVGIPWSV